MQPAFLGTFLLSVLFVNGHGYSGRKSSSSAVPFSAGEKQILAGVRTLIDARSFNAAARLASNEATEAKSKGRRYASALFSYYASRAYGSGGAWGQATASAGECRRTAQEIGNDELISACSFTLAGAYLISNEPELASRESKVMISHAGQSKPNVGVYALASAIAANEGNLNEALQYSGRAVSGAFATGSLEELGLAYNERGLLFLKSGRSDDASLALAEAFRLRQMAKSKRLGQSYHSMGRLMLGTGRFTEARHMFTKAIESPEHDLLPWSYFRLAQASRALNECERAIEETRTSIALVRAMRLDHPFGNDLQVGAEARLQDVADFFLKLAVECGGDRTEEAFLVDQEHRAASLSLRAETAESWRKKLPEDYFAKLAKLRNLEAEAIRTRRHPGADLLSLRADLAAAETRSGLEAAAQYDSSPAERSARLRRSLAKGEVLVSFHLGSPHSYAFTLKDGALAVRRLPDKETIAAQVEQFRKAVEAGSGEAKSLGASLYRELFGALSGGPDGLLTIVPDDVLYGLPFGALVIDGAAGTYLAQRYAIRLAPSAFFFGGRRAHPRPLKFAGVGDPVFNKADPRWEGDRLPAWMRPAPVQLARLISSADEVRDAARLWRDSRLVMGGDIEIARIEQAVREAPGILHVATHILRRDEKFSPSIALGLDRAGKLKVWTAADIAAMDNAPEFVTLSGCGSGRGPALRGAGLLGLTRSWLMAGSRAVVVSYWPVPEESHRLFETYYKTLRDLESESASSRRAAKALQRTQVEAIGRGGWQAEPRYWSAYFVIGAL